MSGKPGQPAGRLGNDSPALLASGERGPLWVGYALAVLTTAVTLLVWEVLLSPWGSQRGSLLIFAIPVTISAWYGGLGPGLLATSLGILIQVFVVRPLAPALPRSEAVLTLLLFAFSGSVISGLCEGLHAARRRILASEREARQAVARLTETLQRQHQTEAALRLSEERLRLALQAANVGLWDYQPTTGACYWNDSWLRMLDLQPGELQPSLGSWQSLLHPDDRAHAEKALADALAGRVAPYCCEFRMRCQGSNWKWILSRAEVLERTPEGTAQRMIGVHIDIDRQKRDEELLRQAKNAAEVASQAKTDFLAHMTHELGTPLNGVIGSLGLLRQTTLDRNQANLAQMARTSAALLASVLNNIIDFSRIETGKLELEQSAFRIDEVMNEVGALLTPLAQEKHLHLTWECSPELVSPRRTVWQSVPPGAELLLVRGDPGRLQQVLLNLVSNAIKFTDRGEVRFRAQLEPAWGETGQPPSLEEPVQVRFEVQDQGIGIGAEDLPRLFQAFSQADRSSRRKHGGTGLGLAISKHLVERMDGMIGVESEPGQGALFWFVVRLARVPASEPRPPGSGRPEALPGGRGSEPPATNHILLVEDNRVNAEVATAILTQAGYRVERAVNGVKAVAAVEQGTYDLVLMDCQLPEMDGLEAARRIRALERRGLFCRADGQPVPIVALTATATRQNRDNCFAAGMTDYLSKPLNAPRLLELIRQRLSRPTGPIEVSEPVLEEEEAPAQTFDAQTFNLGAALARVEGNKELLRKLARMFLGETEGLLERLSEALEQQQAQEVERTAHRLKGQAATFDARAVVKTAADLERLGRQNQLEPAAGLLVRLRGEMERFREELGQFVGA